MAIGLVLGILFAAGNIYFEKKTYATSINLRFLSINNNIYETNLNGKEFINYITFKPNKELIAEKISENTNQTVSITNGIESARLEKSNTIKFIVSASSNEESYNISVKLSEYLCNLYLQKILEYMDIFYFMENKSVSVNPDLKKNIISKTFKPTYYVETVEYKLVSKKNIKLLLYSAIFGMIFGITLGTKKIINLFQSR
jgi:hypothetical protein